MSQSISVKSDSSFELSRIYARGWNAAKSLSSDDLLNLSAEKIAAMNPYQIDEQRMRWRDGFVGGAAR